MSLFNENIHQYFIRTLEMTCICCFNQYQSLRNDFVIFNCRCKMCKICVIEKIKTLTNGKIILNSFEKSEDKNKILLIINISFSNIF